MCLMWWRRSMFLLVFQKGSFCNIGAQCDLSKSLNGYLGKMGWILLYLLIIFTLKKRMILLNSCLKVLLSLLFILQAEKLMLEKGENKEVLCSLWPHGILRNHASQHLLLHILKPSFFLFFFYSILLMKVWLHSIKLLQCCC